MMFILIITGVIFIIIMMNNYNKRNNFPVDNIEPWGQKVKVMTDIIGKRLWKTEQFILIPKSNRVYLLKPSKESGYNAQVKITYSIDSINLHHYDIGIGMDTEYQKSYDISNLNEQKQIKIANDFLLNQLRFSKIHYTY